MWSRFIVLLQIWGIASIAVAADVRATDDLGEEIVLPSPARRIVSLAPHITEILFALGAGDRIVGTVRFSNYPVQARDIPRVGDAFSVNVEAVVSKEPDIVFAWATGGAGSALDRLRALGVPVFVNEARDLESIADGARDIAVLIGREGAGARLAAAYTRELRRIGETRSAGRKTRVFFQISDQNLYTVSNGHLIGQAIELCGGINLFGDSPIPVPLVSQEAVLAANPDVIIISQPEGRAESPWIERWRNYGSLDGKIRTIDPDLISRPSLRMLEGIKALCGLI